MTSWTRGTTQTEAIKLEILNCLEKGQALDKYQIYDIVISKLNVPRPTVRRCARLVIDDLKRKLLVLQPSEMS